MLGRSGGEAFHVLFAADLEGNNVRVVNRLPAKRERMGRRPEDDESTAMKCTVCGAELRATRSDLPFKTSEQTIVILKSLPILQCENCAQYLIEDAVLGRLDEILATVNGAAELQVIRYAA